MQDGNIETTAKVEKLTITLTDARPVIIVKENWPLIAESSWSDHDNQYECQANRTWKAWIKVRQHDDGRTIVYGVYNYSSQFQDEANATYRDGVKLDAREKGVSPSDDDLIHAIRTVGEKLAERSGHECWGDLIAECVADLPAEVLE